MASCDTEVGARIKALREKAGLAQSDLAVALTVSREKIAKIENGEREAKAQDIILLAEQLGTTTDYLLRGMETGNIDICAETGLSNEAVNALRAWHEHKPEITEPDGTITISEDYSVCRQSLEALITRQEGVSFLFHLWEYLTADSGETYALNQERTQFVPADAFIKSKKSSVYLHMKRDMVENALIEMLREPLRLLREGIK